MNHDVIVSRRPTLYIMCTHKALHVQLHIHSVCMIATMRAVESRMWGITSPELAQRQQTESLGKGCWHIAYAFTYICRARDFMQLHILWCKSPFCLKISLFAFFARPVNFNGKCSKLLFQWYEFAVKRIFRPIFDKFCNSPSFNMISHMVTLFKLLSIFPLRLTFAQHFLRSAENLSFLHKLCDFAQNLSFCCLWSPFLPFQIAYFP